MSYLNVDEVETAVQNLAAAYPAISQLIPLPNTTVEGRTSHAIRLGGGAPGSRDAVMMIFGVHAREWGSCEIAVNFAADLLEAFQNNTGLTYGGKSFSAADIQSLLTTLHIVLFPLVNPDGRHYSQTVDSSWRKNRNPAYSATCVGVDVNRNYDFLFDFATAFAPTSGVSVSANPCDFQVYHGPSPFSEAETRNVRALLDSFPRTQWFIDVHSYAQDMLYVWGDDEAQSATPAMNFQNGAFNGTRGIDGDAAYKEFMPADDVTVVQSLSSRFCTDLQGVRGKSYVSKSSFDLYPTSGASDDYVYARHIVDPSKSKVYGFVVEWGTEFQPPWAEMQNVIKDVSAGLIGFCLAAPCASGLTAISLATPTLTFNNVPAGITTTRAAVFSVQSCAAVDLNVAGPVVLTGPGSFGLPLGGGALPVSSSAVERDVRIWVSFTGTVPGDFTTGTMTVTCPQTGQSFVIPITANTIAQATVATCLVLDQSASMDWASGIPGKQRIDVLHEAAPSFITLLPDNDGIGVVSFDHGAYPRLGITQAGPLSGGLGRVLASAAVSNHVTNTAGSTSIGNGVELGHNTVAGVAGYDSTALIVFTDGEENTYKYISDVQGLIDNRVFAVGLGTVNQLNPIALNQLVNNTRGYLLLTDNLGPSDIFKLQKYFVQILASATNADIVVDPDGYLPPKIEIKIPFDLTESDYACDAMILSPSPWAFDFQLETPAGVRIDHNAPGGTLGVRFQQTSNLSVYRLSLPVVAGGVAALPGRWYMVLSVSKGSDRDHFASHRNSTAGRLGVPYSGVVHARSSLHMDAFVTQTSHVPGALFTLRAVLTEMDLPVEQRARVVADVVRPDGSKQSLLLAEIEPGVFEAVTIAAMNGVYPVHFRATGKTLRGFPFSREQLRTGMVWAGGNDTPPRGDGGSSQWCDLLRCLLSDRSIQELLARNHVDVRTIGKCLEGVCHRERG